MSDDSRSILVTGASGGIGRAVCVQLAHSGRALVLAARDEGRLRALCDELRLIRSGRYEAIPVDMGDDAGVATFGERLADRGIVLGGVVMMPPQMQQQGLKVLLSSNRSFEIFKNLWQISHNLRLL